MANSLFVFSLQLVIGEEVRVVKYGLFSYLCSSFIKKWV